jgi:hypothetical protein
MKISDKIAESTQIKKKPEGKKRSGVWGLSEIPVI